MSIMARLKVLTGLLVWTSLIFGSMSSHLFLFFQTAVFGEICPLLLRVR